MWLICWSIISQNDIRYNSHFHSFACGTCQNISNFVYWIKHTRTATVVATSEFQTWNYYFHSLLPHQLLPPCPNLQSGYFVCYFSNNEKPLLPLLFQMNLFIPPFFWESWGGGWVILVTPHNTHVMWLACHCFAQHGRVQANFSPTRMPCGKGTKSRKAIDASRL